MDSNVTKYEVLISDALRSQADVERKENSLKKAKALLDKRSAVLIQDCKKCFEEAVRRYNATESSYKIFDAKIGINLGELVVFAEVRLNYAGGDREPDEFFDDNDHEKILSVLKPFIDEELKKQGTPFTFDSFHVPNHYYPK